MHDVPHIYVQTFHKSYRGDSLMASLHKGFCRCAKSKLPTVMSSSSIKEREGTDLDTVSWENCFMSSPQVLLAASIFKLKILHFLWCSRVWSPTQLFTTCSTLATEPEQGLWQWDKGLGMWLRDCIGLVSCPDPSHTCEREGLVFWATFLSQLPDLRAWIRLQNV